MVSLLLALLAFAVLGAPHVAYGGLIVAFAVLMLSIGTREPPIRRHSILLGGATMLLAGLSLCIHGILPAAVSIALITLALAIALITLALAMRIRRMFARTCATPHR